jgi:VanZ family protein
VALIGYLSLIPHEIEVRTGLPGVIEHVVAYAGTAGLFRLAHPSWAGWRVVVALSVYAACLEGLQSFVPGRSPGVEGALVSGVGAVLGALGAAFISSRTSLEDDRHG